MMSIAQVRSAGSAGNYYTDKDNYYVLGSMGERWAGQTGSSLPEKGLHTATGAAGERCNEKSSLHYSRSQKAE